MLSTQIASIESVFEFTVRNAFKLRAFFVNVIKMKSVEYFYSYSGWHLCFVRIHISTMAITFIIQL